ncbi:Uma2 family endonuclease [Lyngbya confervoides]|uniref:Uma2 family endonuclease n=1 Tax=Lyngbya confervoides BDU141951 TaxID=1574623 RepID=A0ABD4T7W8_9CYAN|nr:Uma2 family endonuclease [Lyngbya confervoides]MCM1984600.1 Uma2 family endonuclease [Lyngbya confervoides BDU141951]
MQVAEQTHIDVVYPSSDGEPLAETYDHLYAMLVTLEVLRQYLEGQQATVLANQFLYYAQGFPRLRVAPDVMVIFGVDPGGRDSYKVWEEGEIPSVVFEMTSKGTQQEDQVYKFRLYAQLGVQEYWLFDPKGEWLPSPLMGYQLSQEDYIQIPELCSQVLGLQLAVEGKLIGFTEMSTGRRLPMPAELSQALAQERERAEQEAQRAEQEAQRAEQLRAQLQGLGIDPVA